MMNLQLKMAKEYQRLFDFFYDEHGLILTNSEMDEIIHEVERHKARIKLTFDLVQYLYRQIKFSEKAFGTTDKVDRTKGIIDHIKKELIEVEESPDDIEEWIDVVMLGFDGAWRNGATPEQIVETLLNKLIKNENRQWPDWTKSDPNKAILHKKD